MLLSKISGARKSRQSVLVQKLFGLQAAKSSGHHHQIWWHVILCHDAYMQDMPTSMRRQGCAKLGLNSY
jgi:hypothetical protein